LLFWPGIIGDFMFYLPFTLIIMLLASLLVAYIINPVFAVDFMKPHKTVKESRAITKGFKMMSLAFLGIIIVGYMVNFGLGNLMLVLFLLILLNKFVFSWAIERFQTKTWPAF